MGDSQLTVKQLNALDQDQFVAALGFVFEHSPWVAAAAWQDRPFHDVSELYLAMRTAMERAPREQQLALIRAHPDLAGKAAIARELTAESAREQASARLDQLSPDEFAAFTRLNSAYRERFGFPFIICVREHTKTSILDQFQARLTNERDAEIATALGEIAKIARLRLLDVVES